MNDNCRHRRRNRQFVLFGQVRPAGRLRVDHLASGLPRPGTARLVEVMYEHWWLAHKREDGADSFAKYPIYSVNDAGKFFLSHGPGRYKAATRGA